VRIAAQAVWMLFGLLVLGFCGYVMADDNTALTYALPIAGMAFFLAASLLILPLMWTASRRQRIVAGLHASLSLGEAATSGDGQTGEFAAVATRVLGQMERFHIMDERRENLEQAERDRLAEYSVQQSIEVHRTRAELDADTARKVEVHMLALAENPFPDDATEDAKTGMKTVPVPDTALEVGYTVDPETRSIKVFYLRAADGTHGGVPADA